MYLPLSLAAPVAAAAALLASPAFAQETPSNGGIPIYDITPQVAPTPAPVPVVTPTPTPRAVPTPRATPVVRASPAPRPTATATPEPRATSTPVPRPTPAVATPVETPAVDPSPAPTIAASPVATPSPVVQDAPVPGADGATPWWVWFLAGIAVAVGGTLLVGRLRRGRAQGGNTAGFTPATPRPPAPVPPVPPVVPPTPAPAPVPPVPPAAPIVEVPYAPLPFLEFQLAPLRVGVEEANALLDFDLTVGNPTSTAVDEVRIATLLLTANAQQDEQLATFFANAEPRGLEPFALPPGQRRHLEATMALPRDAVNVVTRDRPFFVPLMAIDARYRWADGRESRTTAAFVIGPTLPNGKLAPVFLDRGDRMLDRLEARLHGEVRRS